MEYVTQTLLDVIKCKDTPDDLKKSALTSLIHLKKFMKDRHKETMILTLLDIIRGNVSMNVFIGIYDLFAFYYSSLSDILQERIIQRTRELLPRITEPQAVKNMIELLIIGKKYIQNDQIVGLITYFTELAKNQDDEQIKIVSIRALGRYSSLLPDANVQAIAQTLLDIFEKETRLSIKRIIAIAIGDIRKRLSSNIIQRTLTLLFTELQNKNLSAHYGVDLSIVFRTMFHEASLTTQKNMIQEIVDLIKTINIDLVKANLIGSLSHLSADIDEDAILAIIQFLISLIKHESNTKIHYEITKTISALFTYLSQAPATMVIQDILEEFTQETPEPVLKNLSELFRKANRLLPLNLRLQVLSFYENYFEKIKDPYLLEDLFLSYGEILLELPEEPKQEHVESLKRLTTSLTDEWLLLVIKSLVLRAQAEDLTPQALTDVINGLLDQFSKNSNPLIRVRALRLLLSFKDSLNFELREKILQTLELRSSNEDNKIVLPEIQDAIKTLET